MISTREFEDHNLVEEASFIATLRGGNFDNLKMVTGGYSLVAIHFMRSWMSTAVTLTPCALMLENDNGNLLYSNTY